MQYNSYAIRSQSVLTTNSTGRVYNVQFECRAQHTSEIASIACLHNCRSENLTYQLLGSQLWIAFAFEELHSHDRSRVSELHHNSRTKLRIKFCISYYTLPEVCCWFIGPTVEGRVAPEMGGPINQQQTEGRV